LRFFVLDPGVLLKGALVATSLARRLLVLFYFGHQVNFVRLYDTTGRPAPDLPPDMRAEVGGPSYERLVATADARASLIASQIPKWAPDDLGLVVSSPILRGVDDAAERAREVVDKLDPKAVRHRILSAVALLADLDGEQPRTWQMWSSRKPGGVSPATAQLLDTAAASQSYVLVTDDPKLTPDPKAPVAFVERDRREEVTAVRLETFISQFLLLDPTLDGVAGSVLETAPLFPPA
jgi:hypothetical protein